MKFTDLLPSRFRLRGMGVGGNKFSISFRRSKGWLGVITTIMVVGWLVATNHCAIMGTMLRAANTARGDAPGSTCHHCPAPTGSTEGKSRDQGKAPMGCCQSLHATALESVKLAPAFESNSIALNLSVFDWQLAGETLAETPAVVEWDTGPPEALSFAETVLQRSLLSHAPPRLN